MTQQGNISNTPVGEAMHPGVISCTPETPLARVAELMVSHSVHAVFVDGLGPGVRPHEPVVQAFLTDRDLMRAASQGRLTASAGESITSHMGAVGVNDSVVHAAALMAEGGRSQLLVLSEDGRDPVGVISTLDVAAVLARASAA